MSTPPSYEFRKMSIPTKVSMSSCLTCQRSTGLLTPPSSLPSSLTDSISEDASCDDCHNAFRKADHLDNIQMQYKGQPAISKKTAKAQSVDMDIGISEWLCSNSHHYRDFSLDVLGFEVARKKLKVIVIVPAKEVASTVGGVLRSTIQPLVDAKIVSTVYVIDADSKDGTGSVAAACGAHIIQRAGVAAELGGSKGKGDAMWRALLATSPGSSGDEIIAFLDGDTGDPTPAHLIGILGPLIMNDEIQMVRGMFARPFKGSGGDVRPNDGGRVTEIAARPMLNLHFPQLSVFSQPLAGEFAARRGLLEQLAFPVGYGIEIGTLIDAWRLVGLKALAQSDLGTRQNEHKALRDLTLMAFAVTSTVERRLARAPNQDQDARLASRPIPVQVYLPWEKKHREVSAEERKPVREYLKISMALPSPPFVDIDGVPNFRDIGGYPTISGRATRRGLVYRSADFVSCTHQGVEQLQPLGISAVFDLRSSQEVEKAKQKQGTDNYDSWMILPGGPKYHFVPVFENDDYSPQVLLTRFKNYAREGTEGFELAYASILDSATESIRAIFEHLTSPNPRPMLLHCTAGKDRTGVVVMILLLVAGCSPETIAREYALTDIGLGAEWRAETAERLIHHPAFQGKDRAGVERMIGAREEVMLAVIQNLERKYGGVEGYLAEGIVSVDQIHQVRRVLQEPYDG